MLLLYYIILYYIILYYIILYYIILYILYYILYYILLYNSIIRPSSQTIPVLPQQLFTSTPSWFKKLEIYWQSLSLIVATRFTFLILLLLTEYANDV